jgi:hypothetical protein
MMVRLALTWGKDFGPPAGQWSPDAQARGTAAALERHERDERPLGVVLHTGDNHMSATEPTEPASPPPETPVPGGPAETPPPSAPPETPAPSEPMPVEPTPDQPDVPPPMPEPDSPSQPDELPPIDPVVQ